MAEYEDSSAAAISESIGKGNNVEKEEECSVCVAVNIRPLIGNELVEGCRECLQVAAEHSQVTCCGRNFLFDRVYGACAGSPSSNLFGDCIQPLVDMLFKGYNATVLAYGQTGSGKTFTMGSAFTPGETARGVIPSVLDRIFERIKDNPNVECTVRASFVEIHKEEIRDLLVYGENKAKMNRTTTVSVREMPGGGVCLAGATEREVRSKEEIGELLVLGSQLRATASTNMNSRSSRSHAIFTITLEQKKQVSLTDENPKNSADENPKNSTDENPKNSAEEDDGIPEDQMVEDFLTAKMHLVDLAGSERAKRTKAEGQRLQEGIDINKGLLALGKVISSLVEHQKHVPYRDSKLTRLLQDSLGGNSRTVMIACVSPADINMEETINTLRYANQARNIKNKPVVNRDPVAAQLAFLRQQLALARSELAVYKKSGNAEDLHLPHADAFLQEELEKSEKQRKLLKDDNSRLRIQLESALTEAREAQSKQLEAQCKCDTLRIQISQLTQMLDQLQSEGVILPDPIESYPPVGSEDVIQSYLDKIAELERENRGLRDLKAISEDFLERASQAQGSKTKEGGLINRTPMLAFNKAAFARIPELADVDQDLASEQIAAAEEETYRLEQLRLGEELKSLENSLVLKEQQIIKVTASSNQVEVLRLQYEKQLQALENKRNKLEKQRHDLKMKLQNLKALSHEEQLKLEEHYRTQLKEKDEELKGLKKREKELMKVEKLKRKADDACEKLKHDIEKIKAQKVQLYRRIEQKNKEYNEKMKRKEKEMIQLKKQSRATQAKLQKMESLHTKQQTVLRRKTQEAELARKRLKELTNRNQSDLKNRRSCSSSTDTNPTSSGLSSSHWNDKARLEWLEQELDNCNQSIVLKRMLDGEVEQRKYISRVLLETQRRLEHLGVDCLHEQNSSVQKTEAIRTLLNRKEEFEAKIAQHSTQIAEIQKMYEHARSSEEKSGAVSDTKRWNSIKSIAEAKNLLKVLFKIASDLKVQSNEHYTENTHLAEESAELQEKLEVMANEMQSLRKNLVRAEAAAVAAASLASKHPPSKIQSLDRDASAVEDLLQEINHVAPPPNNRHMINILVGNQDASSVPNLFEEDAESDSESSNLDPDWRSLDKEDGDWELSPNGRLHPRNKKLKDDPDVLHFINVCLTRRGEAPSQRLTVALMERELKANIPNWQQGKKSRDVLITEIRHRLMSQGLEDASESRTESEVSDPMLLTVEARQDLRCATPQAREFMKRREDMMGRLERARSRNGRRTASLQPSSTDAQDL